MISANLGVAVAETGQLVWKPVPVNDKTITQDPISESSIIIDDVPYVVYAKDGASYHIRPLKFDGRDWKLIETGTAMNNIVRGNISFYVSNGILYSLDQMNIGINIFDGNEQFKRIGNAFISIITKFTLLMMKAMEIIKRLN